MSILETTLVCNYLAKKSTLVRDITRTFFHMLASIFVLGTIVKSDQFLISKGNLMTFA